MNGPTARQKTVLQIIHDHTRRHAFPPTIREIAEKLGVQSPNAVNDHLNALVNKALLRRSRSKSRGLQITPAGLRELGVEDEFVQEAANDEESAVRVPLLGQIAAGSPIESIEEWDEHVGLATSMLASTRPADVFALRVRGDSMTGDGILDGDLLFVDHRQEPGKGAIVAVQIDSEATVKRIRRENGELVLLSSNPDYAPIRVATDGSRVVRILGPVVGVFRSLEGRRS